MYNITHNEIIDMSNSSKIEWLETNGLGGYASSTILGLNTRRYHGLLVSSLNPPVEREVIVSKLDETIIIDNKTFELSVNQYPGAVHPQGYNYLDEFRKNLFPEFIYSFNQVKIKKTVAAINGRNTTVIIYDILEAVDKFEIRLTPFIAMRNFHSLRKADSNLHAEYSFQKGLLKFKFNDKPTTLFASINVGEFISQQDWYYNFEYLEEMERGLDFREDLFKPGYFTLKVNKGDQLIVTLSTNQINREGVELYESELNRRENLVKDINLKDDVLKHLILAADQFIVKRKAAGQTIIAGYHWFSDWGRDTMISLPGLTISTERYNDAQHILETFASVIDKGMIPNNFPDNGALPEYNTVDATLWFVIAIRRFLDETNDFYFVRETIYPQIKKLIEWHEKGTRYNIHEDYDGLLYAGEPGMQLTWMDAKIGNWVITPRQGKAVEINALWYNLLKIAHDLAKNFNDKDCEIYYKAKAAKVLKNFKETFWYNEGGYLYDFVDGDNRDTSFRPNQLYALSLPYKLLNTDQAKIIVDKVYEKLYTPFGIRSLSPDDKNYNPIYTGDQYSRDAAYHQGTVWSFLLGTFADAIEFAYPEEKNARIKKIIEEFIPHLSLAGIGTVSEIFDGESPNYPKGCIAQAWSVAEFLRIYKKYNYTK